MYQEIVDFIRRNRAAVTSYVAIYVGLSVAVNMLSSLGGSGSAESGLVMFSIFSLGAGGLLLLNRMYFYYRIVASYRPVQTRFGVSALETGKLYLIYFLKATIRFFLASIVVSLIYILIVSPDLNVEGNVGTSLVGLYIVLMVVYQAIYAAMTFSIIFAPHINSATHALSPLQVIETSRKIIAFDRTALLRFYIGYHGIVIVFTSIMPFIKSSATLVVLAVFVYAADVLWSILISLQFIKINTAREAMDGTESPSLLEESPTDN